VLRTRLVKNAATKARRHERIDLQDAPLVAAELGTGLPPPSAPDTQRVSCENDLGERCGFCGEELR
jgi:hypothetical protein